MIEILRNRENTEKIEFTAKDGSETLGRIAGRLDGDVFVINELDCEDFFTDGLVRAILNMVNLNGIDKARFELPDADERLKRLGFYENEPKIDSIAGFFDGKCRGCGG